MRRVFAFLNLVVTAIILSTLTLPVSLVDRRGDFILLMCRWWSRWHLKVCGIKLRLTGAEHAACPPYIFMANHQSALDIFILFAALPPSFRWIAKRELFKIPLFGWALARAGNISVDRGNAREALKAMEKAAQKIRAGTNIVMFPEGTRSKDGKLLPLKRGSFSLAFKAGVPVVPLGIMHSGRLQPVGPFVPERKGTIEIRIGTPIPVEGTSKDKLMEAVRTAIEGLLRAGDEAGAATPCEERHG